MRRATAFSVLPAMMMSSCAAPSPPPSPVAAPTQRARQPDRDDAGTQAITAPQINMDSPCEGLRAEQTLASEQARGSGLSVIAVVSLSPPRMPCSTFANKNGAWAIIARVKSAPPNAPPRLTFDLVALLKSGARKEQRLLEQVLVGNAAPATCEKLLPFDYDGDGIPEVLASCSDESEGGARDEFGGRSVRRSSPATPAQQHVLWTMQDGGEIHPYDAARGLTVETLRDVDGDGRPDLQYSYFNGHARQYVADPSEVPIKSPLLIAHALPNGAFSKDDDVAIRGAKELCPKRPGTLFAPKPDGVSVDALVHNVACARFWGATRDGALATVKKECDAYWKHRSKENGREHDPCLSTELIELYASDPPLRLK